jgi:calcineurin-like phosphoesterase family protein
MNYYLLADSHFGHNKMKEYCSRPEGFEEKILNNLCNTVTSEDVLIHLGDFCIYREEYWHQRFIDCCDGKRWLIKGNHDHKSNTWYLKHGWDFVGDEVKLEMFGKVILLSHKPVTGRSDFALNVHGHLHNTTDRPERSEGLTEQHRLIVMEHEYLPVNLRKVVEGNANINR